MATIPSIGGLKFEGNWATPMVKVSRPPGAGGAGQQAEGEAEAEEETADEARRVPSDGKGPAGMATSRAAFREAPPFPFKGVWGKEKGG